MKGNAAYVHRRTRYSLSHPLHHRSSCRRHSRTWNEAPNNISTISSSMTYSSFSCEWRRTVSANFWFLFESVWPNASIWLPFWRVPVLAWCDHGIVDSSDSTNIHFSLTAESIHWFAHPSKILCSFRQQPTLNNMFWINKICSFNLVALCTHQRTHSEIGCWNLCGDYCLSAFNKKNKRSNTTHKMPVNVESRCFVFSVFLFFWQFPPTCQVSKRATESTESSFLCGPLFVYSSVGNLQRKIIDSKRNQSNIPRATMIHANESV